MKREIREEIDLIIEDDEIHMPIVVYNSTPEKSSKHLGIIFPVFIEKSIDVSFTDGKCRFVDITSLDNINNLESWSEIVIEEVIHKLAFIRKQDN